MPVIWGTHNRSDVFVDLGVVDASALDISALPLLAPAENMPPPTMFRALIDTGAQKTMISTNVINKLDLRPVGKILIAGVGPQAHYHNAYLFHIVFVVPVVSPGQTMAAGIQAPAVVSVHREVIYGAEIPDTGGSFDVLLGMDVISTGSLIVQGNGTFSFSF